MEISCLVISHKKASIKGILKKLGMVIVARL